jgi:hypothetical protein
MKELAGRLAKLKQDLIANYPQWADVKLGLTALAMIRTRILKSGEAATGNFSPYSTKPSLVGASSFRTKAQATAFFGSKEKRKALSWVSLPGGKPKMDQFSGDFNNFRHLAVLPGGYKQLRQLAGAGTGFKNFTWTAEMWGSMHVNVTTDKKVNPNALIKGLGTVHSGNGMFITSIGSENDLTKKKLEGHNKREGKEILQTSEKEEKFLTKMFDDYITGLVQKALNG